MEFWGLSFSLAQSCLLKLFLSESLDRIFSLSLSFSLSSLSFCLLDLCHSTFQKLKYIVLKTRNVLIVFFSLCSFHQLLKDSSFVSRRSKVNPNHC